MEALIAIQRETVVSTHGVAVVATEVALAATHGETLVATEGLPVFKSTLG